MPLTIIQFPKEQVRFLQVIHATQVAAEPPAIFRIQRKTVQVLRVARGVSTVRGHPKRGTSMAASVLSGIATGQEAAFPNATYLRRRYKKLQRCKISRSTNAQSARSNLADPSLDPSFQAIRALNAQPGSKPEPIVVHAIIEDTRHCFAGNVKLLPSTPPTQMNTTPIEQESLSFSERVERMGQAIDRGQQIIFVPSDEPGRINVFARNAAASNACSVDNETFQYTRQRTDTPIISTSQRQDLENRIRAQIAASADTGSTDSIAPAVHHEGHRGVDPRKFCTYGRDGVQCHTISPIPLDYHRPREMATPVVSSGNSASDLSSPTRQIVARRLAEAKHPTHSAQSDRSANAVDGASLWLPNAAPSEGPSPSSRNRSRKAVEDRLERQERDRGVVAWIRRVKANINPAKNSPAKKTRKANGVFRDNPSSGSYKWSGTPIPRPDKVLRDMTNIRQPGYLERNSFAQERNMREHKGTKAKVQARVKPQPEVMPSRPLAGSHFQGTLPQAEFNSHPAGPRTLASERTAIRSHRFADFLPAPTTRSRASSEASMVRPSQSVNKMDHQAFALARLEGRVPPPPASPIQRLADDASLYGSDVELELETHEDGLSSAIKSSV